MSCDSAIVVESLCKTYIYHEKAPGLAASVRSLFRRDRKQRRAVTDVSFSVKPGEIVGLVGPNGAGKTTILKMLAGLIHPSSGHVSVAGHVPTHRKAQFLRSIAMVMGNRQQLIWDLPPTDSFRINQAIYRVPESDYRNRLDELVHMLQLRDVMNKPVRMLSLGERMKCEICAALLHHPQILFLDEPTLGLDSAAQRAVQEFIVSYTSSSRATVLLTSHHMSDVRSMASKVLVINGGRLLHNGTVQSLLERSNSHRTVRVFASRPITRAQCEQIAPVLACSGHHVDLYVQTAQLNQVLLKVVAELEPRDIAVSEIPLDVAIERTCSATDEHRNTPAAVQRAVNG